MLETEFSPLHLMRRPRRNRKNEAIRSLVQESYLQIHNLIAPLFVIEGTNRQETIPSMPGISRFSLDLLLKEIVELYELGIRSINLFPVIPSERKDSLGSEALKNENLIVRAVKAIKKEIPQMITMVDIALDPFTDHGHDGVIDNEGNVLNDATVERLGAMALHVAEAGADIVAPSDMMDGRIAHIRRTLDKSGFDQVGILAYAAKYASAFYGPFRDALGSHLKQGNKKSYQLNPANQREALLEIALDEEEGADLILIKPALAYLDIIAKARAQTNLPLGGYHVSGEYSMVMAASEKGWIDGNRVMMECLLSIKRAGADFILTYAAKKMAEVMQRE